MTPRPSGAPPPQAKPSAKPPAAPPPPAEEGLGLWAAALVLILAAAVGSVIWTGHLYRRPPAEHSPRLSSDYRTADEIAAVREHALAELAGNPEDLKALTNLA